MPRCELHHSLSRPILDVRLTRGLASELSDDEEVAIAIQPESDGEVIEGFRWPLLSQESSNFGVMAVSAVAVLTLLLGVVIYFT